MYDLIGFNVFPRILFEIKTKGYDVFGVYLFCFKVMRFHFKKQE